MKRSDGSKGGVVRPGHHFSKEHKKKNNFPQKQNKYLKFSHGKNQILTYKHRTRAHLMPTHQKGPTASGVHMERLNVYASYKQWRVGS